MKMEVTKVIMRKGDEFTVSKQQGDTIRERISGSNGSTFIHIPHLGATINSADVSEMLDEVQEVSQKENLLGVGVWTEEDQKRRLEIIARTRIELVERGVLRK